MNDGDERILLDGCFYLSGEIPRVTPFEKGRMDHVARQDPSQPWEPDPLLMDERYLAVEVRERGLVVFSACSHAGIVNVLLHAWSRFPEVPIFCVFGGLHLVGSLERIIPETVAGLRSFEPQQIVPAHWHRLPRRARLVERVRGADRRTFGRREPLLVLRRGWTLGP